MKNLLQTPLFIAILIFLITGCSKDDVLESDVPELTQKANLFVKDGMEIFYFWNDKLPDINYKFEKNTIDYFDKLLYEDDKWSFISDDAQSLLNSLEGIEKSFGWSLAFGTFSGTGNVLAVVEYVYPFTPAAEAGIKRGDIIVKMNNADITKDNYTDLLFAESIGITFGIVVNEETISEGSSTSLVSRELQLNPVLKTNIVEHGGHKIGYILYTQFINNYNFALDTALQSMINKQTTDLVIDLRYNPGGYIKTAQHLCSSIAPLDVVNNNSVLVKLIHNKERQKFFENGQIMDRLEEYFNNQVPVKMGLSKIHFITGNGSASASELTITGLKPYMDVTTVGDTTYGKYTGSYTLLPEFIYQNKNESYYNEINNWALQPIVLRYANSVGITDFKDGFAPDILLEEDLLTALPLGTKEEPLFKAAIEDITGTEVIAIKSAVKMKIPYTIFDRGFSKFDKNKREVLINNIDLSQLK